MLTVKDLYRKEDQEVEVYLTSEDKITLPFTKPGVIQFARLYSAFIDSFLPDTLSEVALSKVSRDNQLKLAQENLQKKILDDTSKSAEEKDMFLYATLLVKPSSIAVVETIIKDSFNLEASKLDDVILIQLVGYLITLMSKNVSA
jgi:hypothetical protein